MRDPGIPTQSGFVPFEKVNAECAVQRTKRAVYCVLTQQVLMRICIQIPCEVDCQCQQILHGCRRDLIVFLV